MEEHEGGWGGEEVLGSICFMEGIKARRIPHGVCVCVRVLGLLCGGTKHGTSSRFWPLGFGGFQAFSGTPSIPNVFLYEGFRVLRRKACIKDRKNKTVRHSGFPGCHQAQY